MFSPLILSHLKRYVRSDHWFIDLKKHAYIQEHESHRITGDRQMFWNSCGRCLASKVLGAILLGTRHSAWWSDAIRQDPWPSLKMIGIRESRLNRLPRWNDLLFTNRFLGTYSYIFQYPILLRRDSFLTPTDTNNPNCILGPLQKTEGPLVVVMMPSTRTSAWM